MCTVVVLQPASPLTLTLPSAPCPLFLLPACSTVSDSDGCTTPSTPVLSPKPHDAVAADKCPSELPSAKPLDEADRLLTLHMALKCADLGHLAADLPVHERYGGEPEGETEREWGGHTRQAAV